MESENTVKHAAFAVLCTFPSPAITHLQTSLQKNNVSGYKQPLNAFSGFARILSPLSK